MNTVFEWKPSPMGQKNSTKNLHGHVCAKQLELYGHVYKTIGIIWTSMYVKQLKLYEHVCM